MTVAVSPANHVVGPNYPILRDGLLEDLVNGDIFLNDNGDGTFTSHNVIAKSTSPAGPRLLRLFTESPILPFSCMAL